MIRLSVSIASALVMVLAATYLGAQQENRVDTGTGIYTWELSSRGTSLSLTQILPDQVRAFYVNRGFQVDDIQLYAESCVFMTVLRNDTAPGVVHFRLADWVVQTDAAGHAPLTVDYWLTQPAMKEASAPAKLAFRWAQFPPEQEYQPGGDWNQGMLSMGLPAGTLFDLVFRWDVAGESYSEVMKNVQCAK